MYYMNHLNYVISPLYHLAYMYLKVNSLVAANKIVCYVNLTP